ncbi:hypothetical protein [Agrococcus sp. Marseille-P2731]|uniref:hypothetical protein n=1 Tax=Agrococcus sp. Marseille-P2731 TaxID=1841862 RepID=UPI0009305C1A|nr:hypothetical protein [Agrococcus sp. Marseille-P2731]
MLDPGVQAPTTLLISSFGLPPEAQFRGYCWMGSDLVVGQHGADDYERRTGERVGRGRDGCYTVVEQTAAGFRVGTDSRGLARLFLFRRAGAWVISSSFHDLVEHLRARGVVLRSELALVAAFGVPRGFTDQLASSTTPIADITLVPSFASVVLEASGAEIEMAAMAGDPSYEEALHTYVNVWRGRLSTLLADSRVSMQVDLSGGIDSRTVLAFLLASKEYSPKHPRVSVVSNASKLLDLEVATQVACAYDLTLEEQPQPGRRAAEPLRARRAWRQDSLGMYLPLYFHSTTLDLAAVHAHGAGGGNFRPYYSGSSAGDQVRRARASMSPEHYEQWSEAVSASSRVLEAARPAVHPLTLHYREFRNRFHFGHLPHHSIVFSPLESALTDAVTDRQDHRDGRQIYFDVMESLAPGLKDLPFDDPSKSPSQANVRDLTVVDLETPTPGRVFGEPQGVSGPLALEDPYGIWIEDVARALRRDEVRAVLGADAVAKAASAVRGFQEDQRRSHAHDKELLAASFALAADFIVRG